VIGIRPSALRCRAWSRGEEGVGGDHAGGPAVPGVQAAVLRVRRGQVRSWRPGMTPQASIHRRGWCRCGLIVSILGDPVGVRESRSCDRLSPGAGVRAERGFVACGPGRLDSAGSGVSRSGRGGGEQVVEPCLPGHCSVGVGGWSGACASRAATWMIRVRIVAAGRCGRRRRRGARRRGSGVGDRGAASQASFALNFPLGRCASGPAIKSALTCSMMAWPRAGIRPARRVYGLSVNTA